MNNLFTIIIPTYNRCEMLKGSLEMVIPQVRKWKEDVRLFISDNSSTDGTQELVEYYLQTNGDILHYHRQSENIGAQANFRYAVKNVQSKYVCLLGDDDVVFPNYVETVVNILREHPDVGLVNYNVVSVDYNLRHAFCRESDIRSLSLVVYASGGEFIFNHLKTPSLMSSNVFLRDSFVNNMDNVQINTYPGYDWLAVMYRSVLDKECVFYGYPLLLQRFPPVHRWAVNWPWYCIYGLGRLFKDLDSDVPNLFERWKEYCRTELKGLLNYHLTIVASNKELYKERFLLMKPYMCSVEYERQFRLRINHSKRYVEFVNAPLWLYIKMRRISSFVVSKITKMTKKTTS